MATYQIEEKIFKRYKFNKAELIPFGFTKEKDVYKYSRVFMEEHFRADITVDENGKIKGKIIELAFDDEYTNFRIKSPLGEFANLVKDEYIKILNEIAEHCCEKFYFIYPQSNRIANLIREKYSVNPEFLWNKFPNFGVFRNGRSEKWFGIIINLDKSKILKNEKGEIEVLNVKLDSDVPKYLKIKGIYPSYHLSKKNWVSIILDDTLKDDEIMNLIEISFRLSDITRSWLIPANPKFYNVVEAFNQSDTLNWKQSSNIAVGDTVYLYLGVPISAILFKCSVQETDIPYDYKDENLTMKKVMQIKLLKKYESDEFTFKKLNEFGIKAIRGPRRIPENLENALNEKSK